MDNTPIYDIALKFETELFVSAFGEDFEKSIMSITGEKSGVGSLCTASHTVNINNTPVIPDDEVIENMRRTVFEEVSKGFSERSDVEVRCTKFVGITSIKRKN